MKILKESIDISGSLKGFLRQGDIRRALDTNNFGYIYSVLNDSDFIDLHDMHAFRELMLKLGDNPLDYMDYIPDNYFAESDDIKTYTPPSYIQEIGELAFYRCTNLTDVDLSGCADLKSIKYETFSGCTNLTNVCFPNNLGVIGPYAFENCTSLTSIDLSKCTALDFIDDTCFYGCDNLKVIKIPKSYSMNFKNFCGINSHKCVIERC